MNGDTGKIRETANFWRSKIDAGPLSATERQAFERWMADDPDHARAYGEAELLWKALGDVDYDPSVLTPPDAAGTTGLLSTFRGIFTQRAYGRIGLAGAAAMAVAASLFAVFVLTPVGDMAPADRTATAAATVAVHETGRGQIDTIPLADGSAIVLGAKSRIEVTMTATRRRVRLRSGAAFFDVAHDPARPFVVDAGAARVRVTGTAFDLQRKGDALHVAVADGAVIVSHPSAGAGPDGGQDASQDASQGAAGPAATVTLSAGQGVIAARGRGLGRPFAVRAGDIGAWRSGQLVFFRATLAEIIDDANRYAETPIRVAGDAQDLRMTLTAEAGDPSGLLAMIEAAVPVRIVTRDGIQWIEKRE